MNLTRQEGPHAVPDFKRQLLFVSTLMVPFPDHPGVSPVCR